MLITFREQRGKLISDHFPPQTRFRIFTLRPPSVRPSALVTVLRHIDSAVPDPAEQEVSTGCAQDDGDKQPPVVGHHDEHQEVGDGHLEHVHDRLHDVLLVQDLLADGLLVRPQVLLAAVLVGRQLLQLVRVVVHLLAQILQSLVGDRRQEDQDGHPDKSTRLSHHPGVEQDVLTIAAVELQSIDKNACVNLETGKHEDKIPLHSQSSACCTPFRHPRHRHRGCYGPSCAHWLRWALQRASCRGDRAQPPCDRDRDGP